MAYSENILPRSGAYYSLNRATIEGTDLVLDSSGYAEINISQQTLPKLTPKMLVVVHPSVFSDYYTNDAIQVNLSIITAEGERIEFLIPVSEHQSGVFNTEITLPEVEYVSFIYRIYSAVPVRVYNWELCAEEAADLTTVIDGVEQTVPKLLYDYNTYAYAVEQNELTVGLITCFLQAPTDLQGHFTISFFATERCNVHVRVKDNSITELFSPQVYTVEKGYASVSIPHAYLKKTATDHAFAVTLQCSNGQLSVPVRGMLYTIDGGYLATRLLDAGIDVQDISIRQLNTDFSPSEIWAVGFESNRLIVKSRVYSMLTKANWTAVKDFGEGISAAVEFSGRWISRNNADKYTMETGVMPFVFIVDLENVLKVYTGSTYEEVLILDTGVTQVAACQGFNSMYDITQDQGLVAAYLKDGNVYYRQWLYDEASQRHMWYPIETLYEHGDASFVSVHRLPDYRLGICVVNEAGTKWYVTDRTYVSQAVKPEVIDSSTDGVGIFTVIDNHKVQDVTGLASLNTPEPALVHDIEYIMSFEGPIVFLKGHSSKDLFYGTQVYVNNVLQEDLLKSLTVQGNKITVKLKEPVNGGSDVTIDFSDFYYLAIKIYNNCLHVLKSKSYTWHLALPIITTEFTQIENIRPRLTPTLSAIVSPLVTRPLDAPLERVTANIVPTLQLEVKELITTEVPAASENISANITPTISVEVIKTDSSPI